NALLAAPKPLVAAGDFNAVTWSAAFRRYAELSGTVPVEGIGGTWTDWIVPAWTLRWAGLPIDNVLTSPTITVLDASVLPATMSDHRPILVRFAVPAPTAP
ncbi:MAG: endonuclease/exonuclease/phosphatase family protein, partial [Pseudomonadota bacterium]